MPNYFGYRFVLFASLSLLAINLAVLIYVNSRSSMYVGAATIYTAAAALVALGVWLQSRIARYAGAAWCLLSVAPAIWSMLTGRMVWSTGLLWIIPVGALSLAIGFALILSKRFATEFSEERDRQPKYKKALRKIVLVVLIVAASIAALNDLVHLFAQ